MSQQSHVIYLNILCKLSVIILYNAKTKLLKVSTVNSYLVDANVFDKGT